MNRSGRLVTAAICFVALLVVLWGCEAGVISDGQGGDGDVDGDIDGDVDADVDGDSDADVDGDGDAEGDPCAEVVCEEPGEVCLAGECLQGEADQDGDGVPASDDCDDQDAEVFPGATERCNGADDDCDSSVDEEIAERACVTECGEGTERCEAAGWVCSAPTSCECSPPGSEEREDCGRCGHRLRVCQSDHSWSDWGACEGDSGCPVVCGDGFCEGDEGCSSCEGDCGACPNCPCPSGDNMCNHASGTPDCPMTWPGGYCDPNGDGSYDDGDWDRGWYEFHDNCT